MILELTLSDARKLQFSLAAGKTTIGRGSQSSVRVDDPTLSHLHATLEVTESGASILDMGSKNGLRISGQRVSAGPVSLGQVFLLGKVQCRILPSDRESQRAASPMSDRGSELDSSAARPLVRSELAGQNNSKVERERLAVPLQEGKTLNQRVAVAIAVSMVLTSCLGLTLVIRTRSKARQTSEVAKEPTSPEANTTTAGSKVYQAEAEVSPLKTEQPKIEIDSPASELSAAAVTSLKLATPFVTVSSESEAWSGTAVVFRQSEGATYLLSCEHVVKGSKQVRLVFRSGGHDEAEAEGVVLASDPDSDLACIFLPETPVSVTPLSLPNKAALRETQNLFVAGYPFGDSLATATKNPQISVTKVSVSSLRTDGAGRFHSLQISGDLNPGNSGGPVVDGSLQLLGVVSRKVPNTQLCFATPYPRIEDFLAGKVFLQACKVLQVDKTRIRASIEIGVADPFRKVRSLRVFYARVTPDSLKDAFAVDGRIVPCKKSKVLELKLADRGEPQQITWDRGDDLLADQAFALQVGCTRADGTDWISEPLTLDLAAALSKGPGSGGGSTNSESEKPPQPQPPSLTFADHIAVKDNYSIVENASTKAEIKLKGKFWMGWNEKFNRLLAYEVLETSSMEHFNAEPTTYPKKARYLVRLSNREMVFDDGAKKEASEDCVGHEVIVVADNGWKQSSPTLKDGKLPYFMGVPEIRSVEDHLDLYSCPNPCEDKRLGDSWSYDLATDKTAFNLDSQQLLQKDRRWTIEAFETKNGVSCARLRFEMTIRKKILKDLERKDYSSDAKTSGTLWVELRSDLVIAAELVVEVEESYTRKSEPYTETLRSEIKFSMVKGGADFSKVKTK